MIITREYIYTVTKKRHKRNYKMTWNTNTKMQQRCENARERKTLENAVRVSNISICI